MAAVGLLDLGGAELATIAVHLPALDARNLALAHPRLLDCCMHVARQRLVDELRAFLLPLFKAVREHWRVLVRPEWDWRVEDRAPRFKINDIMCVNGSICERLDNCDDYFLFCGGQRTPYNDDPEPPPRVYVKVHGHAVWFNREYLYVDDCFVQDLEYRPTPPARVAQSGPLAGPIAGLLAECHAVMLSSNRLDAVK